MGETGVARFVTVTFMLCPLELLKQKEWKSGVGLCMFCDQGQESWQDLCVELSADNVTQKVLELWKEM